MSNSRTLVPHTPSGVDWVCTCTRRNAANTRYCDTCNKVKPSAAADMIAKVITDGIHTPAVIVKNMINSDILHGLNSSTSTGILPLRIAITAGRLDYVRAFVDAGALLNSSDRDGPLVHAAVDSEHPLSVDIMRFMLSKGAGPIAGLADRVEAGSRNATSKRYWIDRAQHHLGYDPERLKQYGFENVSALTLGMVGQPLALAWVVQGMAAKLAFPGDGKPLVMVFGGYPGHGKTELSTLLAGMIATTGSKAIDYIKIDCGLAKHDAEFFGHAGGYLGADHDTELNKFLREHDDKPGIVVLDEADKLERNVWESLFAVLDRGNYKARLLGATDREGGVLTRDVSCKKIIWILTTNILDESIAQFEAKHRELIEMAARQMEVGRPGSMAAGMQTAFNSYISPIFRSTFPDTIGSAITRRVDLFIPFFTFTQLECYVLTEREVNQMAITLRRPPASKKEKEKAEDEKAPFVSPIGNITLNVIDQAVKALSKGYDPHGGASSIKTAVKMAVTTPITSMHLRGELTIPMDLADAVPLWLCTAIRNKEEQVEVRLTPPPPQIEEEAASGTIAPTKPMNIFEMEP